LKRLYISLISFLRNSHKHSVLQTEMHLSGCFLAFAKLQCYVVANVNYISRHKFMLLVFLSKVE